MEQQAYEQLERVLWADTAFLAGMGVMDYSLLVGVDRVNHSLVVGIIDFIRQVVPCPPHPPPRGVTVSLLAAKICCSDSCNVGTGDPI